MRIARKRNPGAERGSHWDDEAPERDLSGDVKRVQ